MQHAASFDFARRKKFTYVCGFCFFITLSTINLSASGQTYRSRLLEYDNKPHPGRVWLNDGTQFEGEIIFNDNDGTVLLTHENGKEMKAFNARSLSKFQFDGGPGQADQVFYVLEYLDSETGSKTSAFFEVLKELKEFMVLMRIDPVKDSEGIRVVGNDERRSGFQMTTIFFIGAEGELEPYVKYIRREKDGMLFDTGGKTNRVINPNLLKEYTGEHYPELVRYAKSKKIGFKQKEDLIEILNYYEKLTSQDH